MARLRTCGWEWGDYRELINVAAGNLPSAQTSVVRSGVYSVLFPGTAAGASNVVGPTANSGPLGMGTLATSYFARVYVRLDALPSTTQRIVTIQQTTAIDSGGTIQVTSAGKLQVGSVVTGTVTQRGSDSAATLGLNTWYRVELRVLITNTTTDEVEGQLDGVQIGSGTGLTITDTAPLAIKLGWHTAPGVTSNLYMDDLALNDSTGSAQNTWPGAGTVKLLKPISDNARTGAVAGAAGTTSLFDAVDNSPPTGTTNALAGITTQIRYPNNNATDFYTANLTTYTTAGLAAADTINAVNVCANTGSSLATDAALLGYTVTNPTISEFTIAARPSNAAAVSAYDGGWSWVGGGGTANPSVTLGTSPTLNIRKGTANANIQQVDAAGLYVDYTPGVAAGIPDVAMARVRT